MRSLGRGQSVVLLLSAEMRQNITAFYSSLGEAKYDITVLDILCWSVGETWREQQRLMPLWATHGIRYQLQQGLWDAAKTQDTYELSPATAEKFLRPESQSLQERYHPLRAEIQVGTTTTTTTTNSAEDDDGAGDPGLGFAHIAARCADFGVSILGSASFDEEQERELAIEREENRQHAAVPERKPCRPSLHRDVEDFIVTGKIPAGSKAFLPAFDALAEACAASLPPVPRPFPPPYTSLLVTADFARTVEPTAPPPGVDGAKLPDNSSMELYQRPVRWVATAPAKVPSEGKGGGDGAVTAVLLSSYEANALMPTMYAGPTAATLHLFAPRTSREGPMAEHLRLYTIPALRPGWTAPPTLVQLLILFSGQLYLGSHADFDSMCRLLGVSNNSSDAASREHVQIGDSSRGHCKENASSDSPAGDGTLIPFFRVLFEQIRHHHADISDTHMGRILRGTSATSSTTFRPDYRFSFAPPGATGYNQDTKKRARATRIENQHGGDDVDTDMDESEEEKNRQVRVKRGRQSSQSSPARCI